MGRRGIVELSLDSAWQLIQPRLTDELSIAR